MAPETDANGDGPDASAGARWAAAQPPQELRAGETHVWRMPLCPPLDALASLWAVLDAGEQERARRMTDDVPRAAFVGARGALRRVLAAYLGERADVLRFDYGALGKPHLTGEAARGVRFSIAHSGELALIAVGTAPSIGVDVERERRPARLLRIARRVFAPDTTRLLRTLAADERAAAFLAAWTQQEAYVKAVGGGMLRTADVLPFVWPRPRRPVAVKPRTPDAGAESWTVAPLPMMPGYVATLVVAGAVPRIRCFDAGAWWR